MFRALKSLGVIRDAPLSFPDGKDDMILTEYAVINAEKLPAFLKSMEHALPKLRFEVSNLPYDDKSTAPEFTLHLADKASDCLITVIN